MAYVVRRPGDRWEVRESIATPKGPRARSLTSFRALDDGVLQRAADAAKTPFDEASVVASAKRAGARVVESRANQLARQLLLEIRAGRAPSRGLRGVLMDALSEAGPVAPVPDFQLIAEWIGVSDEERGRILRDLVDLGDHLPHNRSGPLRFPPLGHG